MQPKKQTRKETADMGCQGVISIDGFELAYQIEGEGVPVLVVGSKIYYPRLFSKKIKQALKLIFIDHKGFAKSTTQSFKPEDYRLERILDDIEKMRETLQIEDVVILGHSGHAFLAMEYAKKYPANVRKVVLLNSAPTNSPERQAQSMAFFEETASPDRKRKFEEDIALLAGDIEKEPERRFAHMCIRMGAHSFFDYTIDATPMWEGVCTNMPIIDYLWGEAFARLNMIETLAAFDKPVFVGLGRFDYLVGPVSLWDSVDEGFANVKKVVFEQSGHYPMFEEPTTFDATLVNWIYDGA
jgi:proline iminopeptidase